MVQGVSRVWLAAHAAGLRVKAFRNSGRDVREVGGYLWRLLWATCAFVDFSSGCV